MRLQELTQELIEAEEKIIFSIFGGPGHLSLISAVPGVSQILDCILQIYNTKGMTKNLGVEKTCSIEMLDAFEKPISLRENMIAVYVTSSLSSNYARRGDNQAFILIRDSVGVLRFHVKFCKLPDEFFTNPIYKNIINDVRWNQDENLACIILELILGYSTDLIRSRYEGVEINRL